MDNKNALIIGATGLLGYGVSEQLTKEGWNVRALSRSKLPQNMINPAIEYVQGDMLEKDVLKRALENIDKVFYFVSTTFPKSSSTSLETEINQTLKCLDYTLRTMQECGVTDFIFPSSGGTVYGELTEGLAKETNILKPNTPYGVGKAMSEQVINFYTQQGLNATVLRIGNVHGSPLYRSKPQGVIDVFVQNALDGKPITVWGNAECCVRDYVFLDDFSTAVAAIAKVEDAGFRVYNVGSGVGTSLHDIIASMSMCLEYIPKVEYINEESTTGINRIVLDISKIKEQTNWRPKYDLDSGIRETVARKRNMVK